MTNESDQLIVTMTKEALYRKYAGVYRRAMEEFTELLDQFREGEISMSTVMSEIRVLADRLDVIEES